MPDKPGLGYELDRDAVARYKVDKPDKRPDPDRLVVASWPDGRTMYFASGEVNFALRAAMQGKTPFFERGVTAKRCFFESHFFASSSASCRTRARR